VRFGGLDYDPRRAQADRFRHELDVLAAPLKPREMIFSETKTAVPQPRRAFAGALHGDTYYLVGGMREGFDLVETCEAHDFTANTWRTIACPERLRLSAQLVALGEKLYVAAGSSRGPNGQLEPDPSLEVYDPATNTWTMVLDRLPIEPRHVHMLPYRDRLLLFGTHDTEATAHVVLVAPAG
jgi:N-acetylneuraminic acid mutarotase